MYTKF